MLTLPQLSISASMAARRCRFSKVAAPWLVVVPLFATGCGANDFPYPATTLKGVVKVDGTPIEKGSVTFVPLGRGQAVGAAIRDGEFLAKGVPLGAIIVTFNAMRPTGKLIDAYSQPCAELVSIIPAKYQSGINLEVGAGQEQQTFELTSR